MEILKSSSMDSAGLSWILMFGQVIIVFFVFIIIVAIHKTKQRQKKEEYNIAATSHLGSLEEQLGSLKSELSLIKSDSQAAQEEVKNLIKVKSDLTQELSKQREAGRINTIELERLRKENQELKSTLSGKDKNEQQETLKAEQIEAQLKGRDEKIGSLEKDNKGMLDRLKTFEAEITKLQAENSQLNKGLQDKEVRQASLGAQIGELEQLKKENSDIKKRNERLQVLEKANQDMGARLLDFEANVVKLKKELAEQAGVKVIEKPPEELEKINKENRELNSKLLSQDEERKKLITRGKDLEENLKNKNYVIEDLEKANKNLVARLKELETHAGRTKKAAPEKEAQPEKPTAAGRDIKGKKIGDVLLVHNLITKEALDKATEYQKQYGRNITQYLLHYGYIDENQLAECLCIQFGIPYLPLSSYDISEEVIKLIPVDIAEKHWLIPVDKQGETVMVAMIDPLDKEVIKEVEGITGLKVLPFVGIISEIVAALESYYNVFIPQAKQDGKKVLPFFIDTKTYRGAERRRSIRFEAEIDIQFPAHGKYQRSKTKDVSRDGIAFFSEAILPAGSILPIEIDLPQSVAELPITAIIQIARCKPLENNKFEINAMITKISKQELATIIEYASRKKDNKP